MGKCTINQRILFVDINCNFYGTSYFYLEHSEDNPSKRTPILPNFINLNEQKTKGLLTMLQIKIGCPIKITININKKDSLVNGTFGYVCDVDQEQDIIWCIFSNKVGEVTRRNFWKSNDISKNAIPIVRQ